MTSVRVGWAQSYHLSTQCSIHASMHPDIHPSLRPSFHASVHASIRPCIYLSVHASIHLSVHACVHPSIHSYKPLLSVYWFIDAVLATRATGMNKTKPCPGGTCLPGMEADSKPASKQKRILSRWRTVDRGGGWAAREAVGQRVLTEGSSEEVMFV